MKLAVEFETRIVIRSANAQSVSLSSEFNPLDPPGGHRC